VIGRLHEDAWTVNTPAERCLVRGLFLQQHFVMHAHYALPGNRCTRKLTLLVCYYRINWFFYFTIAFANYICPRSNHQRWCERSPLKYIFRISNSSGSHAACARSLGWRHSCIDNNSNAARSSWSVGISVARSFQHHASGKRLRQNSIRQDTDSKGLKYESSVAEFFKASKASNAKWHKSIAIE
jgi:hypothetical protein